MDALEEQIKKHRDSGSGELIMYLSNSYKPYTASNADEYDRLLDVVPFINTDIPSIERDVEEITALLKKHKFRASRADINMVFYLSPSIYNLFGQEFLDAVEKEFTEGNYFPTINVVGDFVPSKIYDKYKYKNLNENPEE